jgi:hypothetical protein
MRTAYTIIARNPERKDTISEKLGKKVSARFEHKLVNNVCGHGLN